MVFYVVVETAKPLSLPIFVIGRVNDMSVPKGVIREDPSSFAHQWKKGFQVLGVGAFVCIQEDQVEQGVGRVAQLLTKVPKNILRCADAQFYLF